jgi:hypothetical protein
MASVKLSFANGTRLEAEYWRMVIDGKAGVSSFDHHKKYGLSAPIDAVTLLEQTLNEKIVTIASVDDATGRLHFGFWGNVSLHVFNFTSYEIWHTSLWRDFARDSMAKVSSFCSELKFAPFRL